MSIETYVVPAIRTDKILPNTNLPAEAISDQMIITGCPGEFVPATFVVKAVGEDIPSLLAVPIINGIPEGAVDIYAIKCWWQMTRPNNPTKYLNPELLLKDDSLIKVEGGKNYLKRPDGSYQDISYPGPIPTEERYKRWTIEEIPVQDSDTLQPVVIPNGTNKQFWVILKIPYIASGTYLGTIELRGRTSVLGVMNVNVQVLPIDLKNSYWEHSIYYPAKLQAEPTISSQHKNAEQYRAEIKDMVEHGINPTCYQAEYQPTPNIALIEQALAIRAEFGLQPKPLYWIEHPPSRS